MLVFDIQQLIFTLDLLHMFTCILRLITRDLRTFQPCRPLPISYSLINTCNKPATNMIFRYKTVMCYIDTMF